MSIYLEPAKLFYTKLALLCHVHKTSTVSFQCCEPRVRLMYCSHRLRVKELNDSWQNPEYTKTSKIFRLAHQSGQRTCFQRPNQLIVTLADEMAAVKIKITFFLFCTRILLLNCSQSLNNSQMTMKTACLASALPLFFPSSQNARCDIILITDFASVKVASSMIELSPMNLYSFKNEK